MGWLVINLQKIMAVISVLFFLAPSLPRCLLPTLSLSSIPPKFSRNPLTLLLFSQNTLPLQLLTVNLKNTTSFISFSDRDPFTQLVIHLTSTQ